jgi:Uncharacterized phage-associated protein
MLNTMEGGISMYKAIDLSKYIVSKCVRDNIPISNLQLQKILYYIQKEFLRDKGQVSFSDDIEAWQFGPVVPNVYYFFCGFGAMPISRMYDDISVSGIDLVKVDAIVEEKRILDPWVLVSDTHKPDGAWATIYKNGSGNHKVIPIPLIKAVG